ncbi:CBS domain-containing protein [archaeon]|nr:CBS domain-containing protein [archaeon]
MSRSEEAILLREGTTLRKHGNVQGALLRFTEILKLNPQSAIAHREKAITLQIMGEGERAMEEYKKALEIDPTVGTKKASKTKGGKVLKGLTPSGRKVSDIMSRDIISVPFGASARDVADVMVRKNISSVAVSYGGNILGIITERDFIRNFRMIARRGEAGIPAREIMAYPVITIPYDLTLEEAASQMIEKGVRHFLVRDGADIVGMVSHRDILRVYPQIMEGA